VDEVVNVSKSQEGVALADNEDHEFVPLFGLGLTYEVASKVEIYGNVSQSYRPKIYTQAVPTDGTAFVPRDLESSMAWQYEVGFRGRPASWINWDASVFLLDFDDQIGRVALPGGFSTVGNVGRSQHMGAEIAAEVDLIGLVDHLQGNLPASTGKDKDGKTTVTTGGTLAERFGALNLYANVMFLDAEFVSGPLDGLTPRYAPDYLVRTGLVYRAPEDKFRVALLGTFVGDSFGDDSNNPERFVPAHTVWDLTAEARVYKDIVSLHAGINNLFDEDYYSRVRDDGIDPAYGRNYYVGVSLKF
jgi:Fe(3+) dicitrate transport protein